MPKESEALEQYLGDGNSDLIVHFRETVFGKKVNEEEIKSSNN